MRTLYRNKIGSHLSYPIKAAELDELLSPGNETLDLAVRFYAYKSPKQNETRADYSLIEASFNPSKKGWELAVSPVPRSIREEVRLLLLPALVNKVHPWLATKRDAGWHATYHALRCRFDVENQVITFHEHNAP